MHIHKVVLRLPDSWSNWNFSEERGKSLGAKQRSNNKLKPDTLASKPGLGGRRALSPLRHPLLSPYSPSYFSILSILIAPKEEHVLRDGLLETLWGQ